MLRSSSCTDRLMRTTDFPDDQDGRDHATMLLRFSESVSPSVLSRHVFGRAQVVCTAGRTPAAQPGGGLLPVRLRPSLVACVHLGGVQRLRDARHLGEMTRAFKLRDLLKQRLGVSLDSTSGFAQAFAHVPPQ